MSESRELLLALTIFFVLGAWAASAQDGQAGPTDVPTKFDLADYGLAFRTADKFELDELTVWKNVQLQAAAMSEPTVLANYAIGRSESLEVLAAAQQAGILIGALETSDLKMKIGVVDSKGSFIELVDSNACTASVSCDPAIWFALSDFAMIEKDGPVNVMLGNAELLGRPIVGSDLQVFWTGAEGQYDFGSKALLKSIN